MENWKIYITYSLIGAILFPILYYFSTKKDSVICSLIPVIPFIGILGLLLLYNFKGDIEYYLLNINIFAIFYIILFLSIYIFYKNYNNLLYSLIVGILIWLILVYSYIYYSKI
jgi:uncharacterized membrane protein (GlpM family)